MWPKPTRFGGVFYLFFLGGGQEGIWNAQFSILIFALLGSAHILIHSLNFIFF